MIVELCKRVASVGAAVCSLASCGGGGDIAAQNTTFGVSPDTYTLSILSEAEGSCYLSPQYPDTGITVTIVGGVAPYRIRNADPGRGIVDKTEATGKNPTFNVRAAGTECGTVTVSVLDYHSNLATFEYKIESKKLTSTTTQ